jgi:hypothetical protein
MGRLQGHDGTSRSSAEAARRGRASTDIAHSAALEAAKPKPAMTGRMQVYDRQIHSVGFRAFGGDPPGANVMQPC